LYLIYISKLQKGQNQMQKYPLKLKGYTADYIWGGEKLARFWNKEGKRIAESWEVSLYPGRESVIANGSLAGTNLRELLQKKSEWFGAATRFADFPLLVKIIDAASDLSVQVHPSDEYALKAEGGYGKTEMWYVAEAEKGAAIYYGLNRSLTKSEFLQSLQDNKIEELLNEVKIKEGDCFFIQSGTLHAIKAGAVIVEVQQNSNLTYRVYDYDRWDSYGNKRELHIEKAVEVADFKKTDTQMIKNYCSIPPNTLVYLNGCNYFSAYTARVESKMEIGDNNSFCALTALSGSGHIGGEPFVKGDTYLLPCGYFVKAEARGARFIITKVEE
jgi:mannose-6-phosphate isomerase